MNNRYLVALCTLLAGCSKSGPIQKADVNPHMIPTVATLVVHEQELPLQKTFVGRIAALQSANVVARVSGVVLKRLYQEGSEVHKGQQLFEIDPSYYQAQLDTDLAMLAADQATLKNARITARRDHQQQASGAVSQQVVDDADAAERSVAAKVKADQAVVETARINLGYTRITAPINGIAGQQQVTPGSLVGNNSNDSGSNGTLLTNIQQIDSVYIQFTISAQEWLQIQTMRQKGRLHSLNQDQGRVDLILPDGHPYTIPAHLDFSDVSVNPSTGAIGMRAEVRNPDHLLLPGMFVNLSLSVGLRNHVVVVPQQAVQQDQDGSYVLKVNAENKVEQQPVSTDNGPTGQWIVTSGLHAGDHVIIQGLQNSHPGGLVHEKPWQEHLVKRSENPSGSGY